ncbi:MAG: autotransporter assembly complex family protein [Paracoccaceae bacterium]
MERIATRRPELSGPWGRLARHWALGLVVCLSLGQQASALETSLTAPGAPDDLLDKLKAASLTLSANARGLDTPQEILAAARSDYRGLISILYDSAYYSPVIRIRVDGREAANINPLETPSRINRVTIQIEPGRPFRFGVAEIAPVARDTKLPEDFRSGAPAPTGVLQSTAVAAVSGWRDTGHAKARIADQKITARHKEALLDARISVDPGPALDFGVATVSTPSTVREEAIQRIAGFPTGEQFSPEAARRSASRLRRTGAFSSVSLTEADKPKPDGTLDFDIAVVDAKPRRLQFGGEISSTQGLELSFKWVHRNVFGGAERLTFDSRIRNIGGTSDIDGRLLLRLDRPAFFGADNDLFYLLDVELRDEDHYRLFRSQVGVGWRRQITKDTYFETAFAANYNISDDVFGQGRKFYFLSVPSRYRRDKRDNATNATQGYYLNWDATPFVGFNGTSSGIHTLIDGRAYLGFGADSRVVLASRLQLGTVLGASIQSISPDLLFYSGGAGTVRGHPYQSLGIPIGPGVAGGRSFVGISTEVRGRVTDKLSLVGFFDWGAVDAQEFIDENSPSHSGAGLGVRYDVGGIGALRLDLALPVDGTTSDGLQFYFGIGQAF